MRLLCSALALGLATSVAPAPLSSQSPSTAPACSRPEHRQFDFWIGEWDVTLPDGRAAGTNRIRAIHGGCALHEEWSGASGSTGTSLNAFDAAAGRWHQTWIGNDGVLLRLEGGLTNGTMELRGVTAGADGTQTIQRIRWTPLGETPRSVRQLWESSSDGGRTWSVVFDGRYRRRQAKGG